MPAVDAIAITVPTGSKSVKIIVDGNPLYVHPGNFQMAEIVEIPGGEKVVRVSVKTRPSFYLATEDWTIANPTEAESESVIPITAVNGASVSGIDPEDQEAIIEKILPLVYPS